MTDVLPGFGRHCTFHRSVIPGLTRDPFRRPGGAAKPAEWIPGSGAEDDGMGRQMT